MSIFWGLHHSHRCATATLDATEAKFTARDAQMKIRFLEQQCDKTLLVCEALWTLLREKHALTEEELIERVNQIDLTDGKLDGRVRRPPVQCPKCGRTTPKRFFQCIYCGAEIQGDVFAG